jgi:hypothetical protein
MGRLTPGSLSEKQIGEPNASKSMKPTIYCHK